MRAVFKQAMREAAGLAGRQAHWLALPLFFITSALGLWVGHHEPSRGQVLQAVLCLAGINAGLLVAIGACLVMHRLDQHLFGRLSDEQVLSAVRVIVCAAFAGLLVLGVCLYRLKYGVLAAAYPDGPPPGSWVFGVVLVLLVGMALATIGPLAVEQRRWRR